MVTKNVQMVQLPERLLAYRATKFYIQTAKTAILHVRKVQLKATPEVAGVLLRTVVATRLATILTKLAVRMNVRVILYHRLHHAAMEQPVAMTVVTARHGTSAMMRQFTHTVTLVRADTSLLLAALIKRKQGQHLKFVLVAQLQELATNAKQKLVLLKRNVLLTYPVNIYLNIGFIDINIVTDAVAF